MYSEEQIEGQIEHYVDFFNFNWELLEQSLIELGSDPENLTLQSQTRSLVTMLQLAVLKIDHLREQCEKVEASKPTPPAFQWVSPVGYDAVVLAQ